MSSPGAVIGIMIAVVAIVFAGIIFLGEESQEGGTTLETFLDLTDTPGSYAGAGSYLVAVNGTATGLDFISSGSGGLQDLWYTFAADTGSVSAASVADTLTVTGGTNTVATITGKTLDISLFIDSVLEINGEDINAVDSIIGNATYVRVGTPTTSHGVVGANSLVVGGAFEVNELAWLDGGVQVTGVSAFNGNMTVIGDIGVTGGVATSGTVTAGTGFVGLGHNSINDLGDVNTGTWSADAIDGQALVWSGSNGRWEPGTVSGSTPNLQQVTDVGSTTTNDITANDFIIPDWALGTPTYSTVNDTFNMMFSAGRLTGGALTRTGTTTSFTVAGGTGLIRIADDDVSQVKHFDWVASGSSVPTNGSIVYAGVDYNGGSPIVTFKTTNTWDYDTEFPLGSALNVDGDLYVQSNPWWVGDGLTNVIERFQAEGYFERDDYIAGLTLGVTGTRNPTLSSGTIWSRLNEFDISEKDCSAADSFYLFYRDGGGGWTRKGPEQQYSTLYYDNNTGTPTAIPSNRYANWWVFVEVDTVNQGQLMLIYPQNYYSTIAQVKAATVPTFPSVWYEHGILVGRIIFQQGNDTPVEVQSAFSTSFVGTLVTDHGDLAGLSDDDHHQYRAFNIIIADSGSTTANANPDTLTISGTGPIATTISGDTLTIAYTGSSGTPTLQGVTDQGSTTTNPIQFAGGTSTAVLNFSEGLSITNAKWAKWYDSAGVLKETIRLGGNDNLRIRNDSDGDIVIETNDAGGAGSLVSRFRIGGGAAVTSGTWTGIVHVGLALGGTLDANSENLVDLACLVFEGTDDANETTVSVSDPTADRSIVFPDSSGTVALTTDVMTYEIVLTPGGGIVPTAGGADQTLTDGTNMSYYTLAFEPAVNEYAYWEFIIPDNYTSGTINPTIYWVGTPTAGDVKWGIRTVGRADSEQYDAVLGGTQTVVTTIDGTSLDINTSTFTGFDPGWDADDIVVWSMFRLADSGSDTMAGNADMIMAKIAWPANRE